MGVIEKTRFTDRLAHLHSKGKASLPSPVRHQADDGASTKFRYSPKFNGFSLTVIATVTAVVGALLFFAYRYIQSLLQ